MKTAILVRLHDLTAAVQRLERIIADGDPPGMLLARAAISIDEAAAALSDHAAKLTNGSSEEGWPP